MTKDDLTPSDRRILETLKTGRATPRYLADELELERPYVSNRLAELEVRDRVRIVDRGLYELASGEMVHLSEDFAEEIYRRKGRGTSYAEYLEQQVRDGEESPAVAQPDEPVPTETADTTESPVAEESPSTETADTTIGQDDITQLYDELSGEGDILASRADAVVDMWELLKREGSAEKDDFLEVVDPDDVDYKHGDSVWSNMVKGMDTLRALPGVETPPTGRTTWRFRHDE